MKRQNNRKPIRKQQNANTLAGNIFQQAYGPGPAPSTLPYQMIYDNAYNPITLNRVAITYAYMTHSVIQRAINQPVEDALRGGFTIKSDQLDEQEIETLTMYLQTSGTIEVLKAALGWADLFGGAGLIINTDQDPKTPLDVDAITPNNNLGFIDADRWELTLTILNFKKDDVPYNFYNNPIHHSRVIRLLGKEAPSFLRQRLQGWGMSKLERMMRPLNAAFKTEDVIYELLDEAKIDVFGIQGFNDNILASAASNQVVKRLQIMNMQKNYHRALLLDKEDVYDQKQITFSGLAEIMKENRINQAAACNMPIAKLFGMGSSGFSSGEDDIENYNAMIESEIRPKAHKAAAKIIPLVCRHLFGFAPDDCLS